MKSVALILALVLLVGCSPSPPKRTTPAQITALAETIASLAPRVDPAEALRAAEISYDYTAQLAQDYQITDPPLVHNAKVNAGLRPRGLCYHWATDIERRLSAEGFVTLAITRAIANAQNPLLIEHSTAVITAKGAQMQDGIVLDPWRKGGTLFWALVREDTRYPWRPRADVLRAKGQVQYAQRPDTSVAPLPADLTE